MCDHCGNKIETMCFKGSNYCSDNHRRELKVWIMGEQSK